MMIEKLDEMMKLLKLNGVKEVVLPGKRLYTWYMQAFLGDSIKVCRPLYTLFSKNIHVQP